jgi:uncharacterized protein (TIGR03435 family)
MRVTGGPDWVNKTAFAIEGVASMKPTPRQLRMMLQALLEDRFALKVRIEMQTITLPTLVLDRSDGQLGPNVKEWDGTCRISAPAENDEPAMPRWPGGYRPNGLFLEGVTMFTVAEWLSLPQSRTLMGGIVGDRTGLNGRYTLELNYPFAQAGAGGSDFAGPSLPTVVREQWGLRLERGPGSFRRVVVESAQPPTDN